MLRSTKDLLLPDDIPKLYQELFEVYEHETQKVQKRPRTVSFDEAIIVTQVEEYANTETTTTATSEKAAASLLLLGGTVDQQQQQDADADAHREHRLSLWYQPDEIGKFKREVGNLLIHKKYNKTDQHNVAYAGLERHCPSRDKAKKNTIRLVVFFAQKVNKKAHHYPQHHHHKDNADFLRQVSKQCSHEARQVAIVQGVEDYSQVYGQQEQDDQQQAIIMLAGHNNNKRSLGTTTTTTATSGNSPLPEDSRRVRQRVVAMAG